MAVYSCNMFIKNYLVGKGFTPDSNDYRYYYFTDSEELQLAVSLMPFWYKYLFANAWS